MQNKPPLMHTLNASIKYPIKNSKFNLPDFISSLLWNSNNILPLYMKSLFRIFGIKILFQNNSKWFHSVAIPHLETRKWTSMMRALITEIIFQQLKWVKCFYLFPNSFQIFPFIQNLPKSFSFKNISHNITIMFQILLKNSFQTLKIKFQKHPGGLNLKVST